MKITTHPNIEGVNWIFAKLFWVQTFKYIYIYICVCVCVCNNKRIKNFNGDHGLPWSKNLSKDGSVLVCQCVCLKK